MLKETGEKETGERPLSLGGKKDENRPLSLFSLLNCFELNCFISSDWNHAE